MAKNKASYLFQNIDEIKDIPKYELRKLILRSIVDFMDYEAKIIPTPEYVRYIIKDIDKNGDWNKGFISIEGTLNYLIDKGFINHPGSSIYTLMAKGIDEIENDFPILDPPIKTSISKGPILLDSEDDNEFIQNVENLKVAIRVLEDFQNDITYIKSKLDNILITIKDNDLQNRINDVINSSNPIAFIHSSKRLIAHPKVTETIKDIFQSKGLLTLPPHTK